MCLTVPFVRAGSRDHIDQAAGGTAEFGSEAVGDDLKFLHGFERYREVFRFKGAEEFAEEVVKTVLAVDYQTCIIALLSAQTDAAAQAGDNLGRRTQFSQVTIIASRERKRFQVSFINDLINSRRARINGASRGRGYRYRLRLAFHWQCDIEPQTRADFDVNVGQRDARKSRRFSINFEDPGNQIGEVI